MSFETPSTSKPPRLRYISLWVCPIPWDSGLLSGLKTLELHRLEKESPSLDQLINFLHASPDLVRLTLRKWDAQVVTLSNYTEIVTLQSLETFEVEHITSHVAEHLNILRIPKCTRFRLKIDHLLDTRLLDPSMEHLFPMLRVIMASCDETEIMIHRFGLAVASCNERRRLLNIELSTDEAPQDGQIVVNDRLRNLLDSSIAIPSARLLIYTDIEHFLPMILPLVEGSCPIEELTLSQEGPDPNVSDKLSGALGLLSKPRGVDGVTRWPLPNLKILKIEHATWAELKPLVNMVRNRYTDCEPQETYE
ncbi:hypothetical protein FRB93_003159 [Tulasnella sp. JGI-2019a]|nr:hypothetical protein FRB93_003159 [Tulasnella sp. JGI-2019a]